ncbi:MAG: TlpA family protein disulfide reductase [Cyclobacteriaceae bacterium]|nr:TlpA family protein disulfide reductase [Cyclobacteriaceae bacterium]
MKNISAVIALAVVFSSCNPSKPLEAVTENGNSPAVAGEESATMVVNSLFDLPLVNVTGDTVFIAKDKKLVFVNFWATWCGPCIKEMPSMQRMMEQLGDDMGYYYLSYEDAGKVRGFAEKAAIGLPLYSYNDMLLPAKYRTDFLPYTIILQGDVVVYERTGATEWDQGEEFEKIAALLGSTR